MPEAEAKFSMAQVAGVAAAALLAAAALWCGGCAKNRGRAEKDAALRAMAAGQYIRSVELFEAALQQSTGAAERAEIYNFIGVAYWKMDMPEPAYEAFSRSRELNPAAAEPVLNMGVMAKLSGNTLHAAALFEQAAAMSTNEFRALLFLAETHEEQGRLSDARQAVAEAVRRAPASPEALTAQAVLALKGGDAAGAEAALMRALAAGGDYAPALFNLAELHYYWNNSPGRALPYYRRFLKSASRNDALRAKARAAVEAIEGRGPEAAAAAGPAAAAGGLQELDVLLRNAAEAAAAGKKAAAFDLFMRAAAAASDAGRSDIEQTALEEAEKFCPDEAEASFSLGCRLAERGRYSAAMRHLARALAAAPAMLEARIMLVQVAAAAGDYEAAAAAAREVLKAQPDNADAAWLLAVLYDRQLGRPSDALAAYKDFAGKFPADPRAEGARARAETLEKKMK